MNEELMKVIPYGDMERMADCLARSGLFGIKQPVQALALMLVAQAEGRHPALVARDFDIIQGRPALKAKAKLARFQQAGGKFRWLERSDAVCAAEFVHPSCPDPIAIRWTMDDARRAGLGGKDNWKHYPRQMLSARVISEGVDATFPDAGGLMYTPEEVVDFEPILPSLPPPEFSEDERAYMNSLATPDLPIGALEERARANPDKFRQSVAAWVAGNKGTAGLKEKLKRGRPKADPAPTPTPAPEMPPGASSAPTAAMPDMIPCPNGANLMIPAEECKLCEDREGCPSH